MDQRQIFVVSDSTGETAERVVRAALLQFVDHRIRVRLHTRIRDAAGVDDILGKAARENALVVFTLVSPELRAHFHETARKLNVESIDVIGALIHKISGVFELPALNMPTATQPLSEEYFKRVEAIEFAVKSDDGKEPRNLRRADIILVGVSRTSKTPLSTYLAGRGYRVANVPLVLGVTPPAELDELPPEKVVGVTIGIEQLLEIRRARLQQLGMPVDTNYGLPEHVRTELEFAESIFKAHPKWLIIDVSGRAIEETATIILESIKERDTTP